MRRLLDVTVGVRTLATIVAMSLVAGVLSVQADDKTDAEQLVERSKFVVESFTVDRDMGSLRESAQKAKAIYVVPEALRAAFVIGAKGGSGVLVARDTKTGKWVGPTFHSLGGASFGFQAGADSAEVVMLAMTERGLTQMLNSTFKLGGDASVAAGSMGAGVGGATAGLSADILLYSRAKGLYGGFSVDGAVVSVKDSLNAAYYGKPVSPTDVLVRGTAQNPKATPLLEAVGKLAAAK